MKNSKKRILFIGYGTLTVLAIIFLGLAIFTEDGNNYLFAGLASMAVANLFKLISDLDDRKNKKEQNPIR